MEREERLKKKKVPKFQEKEPKAKKSKNSFKFFFSL